MRFDLKDRRTQLITAGILVAVGLVLSVIPLVLKASSDRARVEADAKKPLAGGTTIQRPARVATPTASEEESETTVSASASTWAALDAANQAATPATPPAEAASTGLSIRAYNGLGIWVDIYDDPALNNPKAAVADMAKHGVRTLYLETGNSRSDYLAKNPSVISAFISESHAKGMLIVAWYLPDMTDLDKDYGRIKKAIKFRTSDGQGFDSFALDIESGAVKSVSARNAALEKLSSQIRSLVGANYPLGAIIPSPVGLSRKGSYWGNFPYQMLAEKYDVFVPMSYYTYHGDGAKAAYNDTVSNVRILRSKPGCAKEPIHMIGGIAGRQSSTAEVEAFVRGVRDTKCEGASLYSWPDMKSGYWKALSAVKSN